jgi:enterochelin esterase-like enzyme
VGTGLTLTRLPAAIVTPSPAGGQFVSYRAFATETVTPRQVRIWLPPGYDQGRQRYNALYMHDGQNLFEPPDSIAFGPWDVDRCLVALAHKGEVGPTIVVGIWSLGADRAREYAPAAPLNTLPQDLRDEATKTSADGDTTPLSDRYLHFMVYELKPFVDANFRTRPDPSGTIVMGSSMGGLISLYALASFPDIFGAVGCLSTHWPITTNPTLLGNPADTRVEQIAATYRIWLSQHLPTAGHHRLYFDHGSETLDALFAPYQEKIDALIAGKGYRRDLDWRSEIFPGDAHNEAAWRKRLHIPLTFLLRA